MNLQIIAENGFVSRYKLFLVREVIRMGWVGGMVILRAGSGRNESGNPKLTSWRSGPPVVGPQNPADDEIYAIMNQERDGNPVIL